MSTLDERRSKAFDVVLDTTKLLITLSTAVIGFLASAILINSSSDKNSLAVLKEHHCGISYSITLLAFCVLFGLLTILKISGILGNERKVQGDKVTIYDGATRFFFSIMLLLFLLAVGLLGFITLGELK